MTTRKPGENDDPLYPLFIYVYNADGYHSGPQPIDNEIALGVRMQTTIREAFASKREVRITDCGDCMVLHIKNGAIEFPTEQDIEEQAT
jgi:hypothetical protein